MGHATALADAIQKLDADPVQSREMGLAGRRYIEKYFYRATLAEQLTGILEEMVRRKKDVEKSAGISG